MKQAIFLFAIVFFVFSSAFAQFGDPPGLVVGTTQYSVQSSGVSANRIAFDAAGGVHFTWMVGSSMFDRNVRYNFLDEDGQWLASGGVQVNEVNGGGYPTLAINADNAAMVTYHNVSNNYVNLAVDLFRGMGIFEYFDPPDNIPGGGNAFWPQVAFSANGDIHILSVQHTQDQGVYPKMIYTRSTDGGQSWTATETVAEVALLNGCITASPDGKVAIVYLEPVISGEFSQVKNDVCYYISEDGRSWEFRNPENITEYGDDGEDLFCPWGIDAVFDNDGNLNVVWVTGHIDIDGYFIDEGCELWHYSEATGAVSQLAESTDPELTCMYGAVTLPISMPGIAINRYTGGDALAVVYVGYDETDASSEGECLGDLYAVYGFSNGEIWDGPYNITDTHSPNCAPGNCMSENFPSISENADFFAHPTYIMQKMGEIPDTAYYMPIEFPIQESIDDNDALPGSFTLLGNYPNPFNASTQIGFELAANSPVKLTVYNITGARVAVLCDRQMDAGKHSVVWNADSFASGTYFYKLDTGAESRTEKMVLLK